MLEELDQWWLIMLFIPIKERNKPTQRTASSASQRYDLRKIVCGV
jgi:hypothetical protein